MVDPRVRPRSFCFDDRTLSASIGDEETLEQRLIYLPAETDAVRFG
jgi:hypothetical protein